jgi:hypothetical protein
MHQPLHTGFARMSGKARGSLDVHRVEAFPAVLDVEADRIDGTKGSGKCCRHGPLIMHIGRHRQRRRLIRPKHRLNPLRMARGHPHPKPAPEEMPHDPASKEAGPTEHGNQSLMLKGAPFGACGRGHHVGSAI